MKQPKEFWDLNRPKMRAICSRAALMGYKPASLTELRDKLPLAMAENNLNLDKLLAFPAYDFLHDLDGIVSRIDLDGQFQNCFWPRCGSVAS